MYRAVTPLQMTVLNVACYKTIADDSWMYHVVTQLQMTVLNVSRGNPIADDSFKCSML